MTTYVSLAHVSSNRAIVILLAEVGFAAFSAWWLAEESLGWREWGGGVLILAASVFSAKKIENKNDVSEKAHG